MNALTATLIKNYQAHVAAAVELLCEHLNTREPMNWRSLGIPQVGALGEGKYFFHGSGVAVEHPKAAVDFDFGHEGRIDGVSPWKLADHAQRLGAGFRDLQNWQTVKAHLDEGEKEGLLARPHLSKHDDLYYWTNQHDSDGPVTVTVVLDPEYGDRISEAASVGPVWVTPSGPNRSAVERYWRGRTPDSYMVTYWSDPRTGSSEAEWVSILDDLDLHHSGSWAGPGVAAIHVIGVALSIHAHSALRDFGYQVTDMAATSFRATRIREKPFDAPAE